MLTDLTAAKIDHGLAKLALDQLKGEGPVPGKVTQEDMASRAGISRSSYRRYEQSVLAKFSARLLAEPDLPPFLVRRIADRLK